LAFVRQELSRIVACHNTSIHQQTYVFSSRTMSCACDRTMPSLVLVKPSPFQMQHPTRIAVCVCLCMLHELRSLPPVGGFVAVSLLLCHICRYWVPRGTWAARRGFRNPRLRASRAAGAQVVLGLESVSQNTRQCWPFWIRRRGRQHLHDLVQCYVRL
jgi:hypothetical protein